MNIKHLLQNLQSNLCSAAIFLRKVVHLIDVFLSVSLFIGQPAI